MEFYYRAWIVLLLTPSLAYEELMIHDFDLDSNVTETNVKDTSSVQCEREHLYDGMNISEVLGTWQVVELYTHLNPEGVNTYHSCPVAKIWEEQEFPISTFFGPSTENQLFHVQHLNSKFRHEYRQLRLLWVEGDQNVEYSLFFKNNTAGYWQVFNEQNGTMAALGSYQQFSGTIQVLKAVNDHLVLNFCQEAMNGRPAQLYSVLFSRDPAVMSRWEMESVHAMLQTKKLSVESRRIVCGNSADKPLYSLVATIILFALTYVIS